MDFIGFGKEKTTKSAAPQPPASRLMSSHKEDDRKIERTSMRSVTALPTTPCFQSIKSGFSCSIVFGLLIQLNHSMAEREKGAGRSVETRSDGHRWWIRPRDFRSGFFLLSLFPFVSFFYIFYYRLLFLSDYILFYILFASLSPPCCVLIHIGIDGKDSRLLFSSYMCCLCAVCLLYAASSYIHEFEREKSGYRAQ